MVGRHLTILSPRKSARILVRQVVTLPVHRVGRTPEGPARDGGGLRGIPFRVSVRQVVAAVVESVVGAERL